MSTAIEALTDCEAADFLRLTGVFTSNLTALESEALYRHAVEVCDRENWTHALPAALWASAEHARARGTHFATRRGDV